MFDRSQGSRRTATGIRIALGAALAISLAVAPAAMAKNVPGNNGTVKIHDGTAETEPITRNEPHVGCPFHLHFMFGDDDQTGNWGIASWPPTGDGTTVLTGAYDATGDGEDRADVSLASGHYKLFWDGDTNKSPKHKTFWVVGECEDGDGGGGDV